MTFWQGNGNARVTHRPGANEELDEHVLANTLIELALVIISRLHALVATRVLVEGKVALW